MPRYALDERHDFAATLRRVPADSPTLCGDWDAAQLTAHLVLRERSLIEAGGRTHIEPLRARAQRAIDGLVDELPYPQLVGCFEAGAPRFSPLAFPVVREAVNLLEYVVHHEDVRRAATLTGAIALPRELPVARQRAVWTKLRLAAKLTLRRLPVGVRLVCPYGSVDTRRDVAVTITGDPVELALLAFGRQGAALARYDGSPRDVAAVSNAAIAI